MSDHEYTEFVSVLRGHLEEVQIAVENAYGASKASDLVRQYQNVGGVYKPSNLTRKLDKALSHIEGYLLIEDSDELSE